MLEEKLFSDRGTALNYAEGPDNGPPVLLLHGLGFGWRSFLPLMPDLSKSWHVYAPDLRGHGGSSRTPGRYHLDHFADDAVALVEDLVGGPAVLVGHSLGAAVAFAAAARLGTAARAVVIGDVALYGQSQREIMAQGALRVINAALQALASRGGTAEEIASALAGVAIPIGDSVVRLGDLPGNDAAFLRGWGEYLTRLDPEAVNVVLDERLSDTYDAAAYLPRFQCPVLLIQADASLGGLMSDNDVGNFLAARPDTYHVRCDGVGHMLHMHHAQPVLDALLDFLNSL